MKIIDYDYTTYKNRKLIVYGAGAMRDITVDCLNALNISVSYYANRKASYHALYGNIISVETMLDIYEKENVLILFTVPWRARSEAEYLYGKGIKEIYSVRKLWSAISDFSLFNWDDSAQKLFSDADRLFFIEDAIAYPERIYLHSLDVVVTERCSLRCKDCSNLMQYYQCPQNMDVSALKESIDRLLEKIYSIFEFVILGGEPFLNKDFVKLIDWYKDEKKIVRILVLSNATIFPNEDILEHLKAEKVFLSLSDYGALSLKLNEWIQWCTKNNVKYQIFKMEQWHDCGRLERHDYCEQELMGVYGACECRNLPTIIGNYLYNCPYAANAANLGAMYPDEISRDRILLTDDIGAEDIERFLYERKYLEACRYCNGRNYKKAAITPHIQAEKPLEYRKMVEELLITEKKVKMDYLVSVVVPTFNSEQFIERCISSVLDSSYTKLEIIIVDDGSEDNTVGLCKALAAKDALRRVKIIRQEHSGTAKARNTGILEAKGEYITFIDSDDWIANDRLAHMVEAMDGCDLVNGGYVYIIESRAVHDSLMDRGQGKLQFHDLSISEGIYEGERLKSYIKKGITNDVELAYLWTKIFRTDILKNICEKVDTSIWHGEDAVLAYMYMPHCSRIRVIKDFGYYYSIHDNYSRYKWDKMLSNIEREYNCLQREFETLPNAEELEGSLLEMYRKEIEFSISVRFKQNKNFNRIKHIYYPYYGRLKDKKIILYGAGNVGQAYYKHMKADRECTLMAWVDKNAVEIMENKLLPVEKVDCIFHLEYDYVVIAVFDEPVYKMIQTELICAGIEKEKIIWNPTKYEL